MSSGTARRHLLSIEDLSDQDLRELLARGCEYATGTAARDLPLTGRVVGVYFNKTSTRTRTAFSVGALRLGAHIVTYGPSDLQLNTGESMEDTGQVLSGMLDVLVARTAGDPREMRTLAKQSRMAVVNAMSADEHPTQALADLTTMLQRFGSIEGLRILYMGEGNNTAAALALALARYPNIRLYFRTPPEHGLLPDKLEAAKARARRNGAKIDERHDPQDLPADVDIVYTTRWETTGTSKANPDWRQMFAPFRVDATLMRHYPRAVFMHDLPAHRGEEVTTDVIDGPASIVFQQAENKLYSAMAVLEWCLGGVSQ